MLVHKSYKFRLYPSKEQEVLLSKHFGSCRFVYNYFLGKSIEAYETEKKTLTYNSNAAELTKLKKADYEWLKEVNSQSTQYALKCLESAYKRFFKEKKGFPKFKKKSSKQSFTCLQNVKVSERGLSIPKFKSPIKMIKHREIEGKILSVTLSKTPTGKYYVSLTCEVEHIPYTKTKCKVGIDTGIKDLAILSDGTVFSNIKPLKKNIKKLKFKQRQMSKKVKGSVSRNKSRFELACIHERITNIRKDYLHKVSNSIIKLYDVICIEDLNIRGMVKNHKLAQALSDVALGTFYQFLDYKSKWNERVISKVDRWFASSKTCNVCDYHNGMLTLSIREWSCPECGTTLDRDLNAAQNILTEGLRLI